MPCQYLKINGLNDYFAIKQLTDKLAERSSFSPTIEGNVKNIINEVKKMGDDALIRYNQDFDCKSFCLQQLRVKPEELEQAYLSIPETDLAIIREAADNIKEFHLLQKEKSWFITRADGSILGQRVTPVSRAGVYIPGGQAGLTPLISTILMTVIPALVAGVSEIVLVSPPGSDGRINSYILATAHLLGVKEVYAVGSAWAIAALAYGTKTIKAVEVIAGPGNIYVTVAKRLVMGEVGIDMLAGPSEVLVIADALANPKYIAADMLSQAEHDKFASAVCISPCASLLREVEVELKKQCAALPKANIAAISLQDWGFLIEVPDIDLACVISNQIAPEHLELLCVDNWSLLPKLNNAGAIFMGEYSPESVGDYFAGTNHVLPTMGTAKFSSALGVETFCKKTSIIACTKEFLHNSGAKIARLARLEGLEGHALSVEVRE